MRHFSAALLSRALGPVIAFFSSPRGRHSTVAGRRRRSTRVRRYAPPPLPALPAPEPRPAPPHGSLPVDDVALVRPYYGAHERLSEAAARIPAPRRPAPETEPHEVAREFARVQERAAALLRQWSAVPDGDLLAGPAPRFGVVRPPVPSRPAPPSEWDELASLARTWFDQQRQGVPA